VLEKIEWIGAIEQRGDTLLVDAPGERAPEMNALLIRHDVQVAEIRMHTETLEAFFLEVTEDT
jgi:hypothetical protein